MVRLKVVQWDTLSSSQYIKDGHPNDPATNLYESDARLKRNTVGYDDGYKFVSPKVWEEDHKRFFGTIFRLVWTWLSG
ncbi:hypothetical protein ACVR0P_01060 [Streptococcus castoreus]|uniref:hypothetical protein n=1 Tax=Streptococcus castoreus TaxID=254786 RepID=UPI0004001D0C|nr:hypothetical protein [Streptococcus castoreus]